MSKVALVTGETGLLGTALVEHLEEKDDNVRGLSSSLDLLDPDAIFWFFTDGIKDGTISPGASSVYHLAARVGGIQANNNGLATFFDDNIRMNVEFLKACQEFGVKRLISVMSSCVYPEERFVTYPLTEDQLHLGPPHDSNFGYAYAKRMLDVQTQAYRAQHGVDYVTVIPNNLFGEHDNFHLEDGHVLPALIRKVWEAKLSDSPNIVVWGDGTPLREFTYAKDAAKILRVVEEEYHYEYPLNIGCTEERSIGEIARLVCEYLEYDGTILFNASKPNGQRRKPTSNESLLSLTSWKESDYTPFEVALKNTCEWFVQNYPAVRGVK
jgi:GDP-L-fucose synthase